MKNLYLLILILSGSISYAQSVLTEHIELSPNQTVHFNFDDATLISLKGWQENHISIEGNISINGNTQNDKYTIDIADEKGIKIIKGFLKDKDKIPRVISIKKGDELFTFNTNDWNSPELQKFYAENGEEGISWKSNGISWDIKILIKVPVNQNFAVSSKHGLVEINNIRGNISANSVHGGLDLSVSNNAQCRIDAQTKWGEIYSNLVLKIDPKSSSSEDWNHVVGTINGGGSQSISLTSKHANIYLRSK